MSYNFEQFTGARGKFTAYRITINGSGGFQLSPGFYFKNNIRGAKSASVFFDRENRAIGLGFSEKENVPGTFKIVHRGNSATIAAKSFFIAYGLDTKQISGRYEPESFADTAHGAIFVIGLDRKLH